MYSNEDIYNNNPHYQNTSGVNNNYSHYQNNEDASNKYSHFQVNQAYNFDVRYILIKDISKYTNYRVKTSY